MAFSEPGIIANNYRILPRMDKEEYAAYIARMAGIAAPDIGEVVMFKWGHLEVPTRHRVEGWYRALPEDEEPPREGSAKIAWYAARGDRNRRRANGTVTIMPCLRAEATHVGIYSTCGSIVSVDRVTASGEYVPWPKERLDQDRDAWCYRATAGEGYSTMLEVVP